MRRVHRFASHRVGGEVVFAFGSVSDHPDTLLFRDICGVERLSLYLIFLPSTLGASCKSLAYSLAFFNLA